MRVAVTGSAGRIGAAVVADLAGRGHEVTGLDLRRGDHPGVRHLASDLTNAGHVYSGLAGADAVVHLAAWSGAVPDTEVYTANSAGVFHILRACADLGIRRVVTASSAQVYGFKLIPPSTSPSTRTTPCARRTATPWPRSPARRRPPTSASATASRPSPSASWASAGPRRSPRRSRS